MQKVNRYGGVKCLALAVSVAVAGLSPSVGNCAGIFQRTIDWKEEILLQDGSILVIDRVDFIGGKGPLVERSQIRFKLNQAKEVSWESCAKPVAINLVEGSFHIVGFADFTFCSPLLGTYTPGGYAAWRLEGTNFVRIKNESVPRSLVPNLVYVSKHAQAQGSVIRYAQKRGELHVSPGINWCKEAWRADGDVDKCKTKEGN